MPILLPEDRNVKLSKMLKVKQNFKDDRIEDVEASVSEIFAQEKISSLIHPGQKIAVAVGSRMIDRIQNIVKQIVTELKARGAEPFIVTAMGSHGGGTPEGCKRILEDFGITEESVGVPIKADMDVVKVGTTEGGIDVYMDKNAYEADMTILVNRIKPHTEFTGRYESGICKLSTIGLGRHVGCTSLHKGGTLNFDTIIPQAAKVIFDSANIGFAVGIIENAFDKVKHIEGMTKDEVFDREPELLKIAKASMPSIGIPEIDVLVIGEIGKDISGFGMDPNIVGLIGPKAEEPGVPKIGKVIVLRLSEKSHGNACGIGLADLTTKEVYDNIDFESTYANSFACDGSFGYWTEYIPIVMTDEQEAIAGAVKMLRITEPEKCRIVKIKNTLNLLEMEVSENLREVLEQNPERFTIIED